MDFHQAAHGVSTAPAPLVPRTIVSDTDGTLYFGTLDLNRTLAKFLALAAKAGHNVFVVTRRGGYDGALDSIRVTLKFAERRLKEDLSSVRVLFKDELKGVIEQEQLSQPWLVFEDDVKQLQGPDAYASPVFAELIVGNSMENNLPEMRFYAKELGFADEFEAYLQQLPPSPAPAPAR